MNRFAGLLFLGTAAAAALFLFLIKYEVQELEDEFAAVQRDILRHQEAIHVLKAEWTLLNRPARIADLAHRHLALEPLSADRIVTLDDLPLRADRQGGRNDGVAPAVDATPGRAGAPGPAGAGRGTDPRSPR
ncbi:MAG: hypothetical protein ACE5KF_10880 [Kiloniellaceae bacterium]